MRDNDEQTRTVELAALVELEALGQPHGDVVLPVQRLPFDHVCAHGIGGVCVSEEDRLVWGLEIGRANDDEGLPMISHPVSRTPTHRQGLDVGAALPDHGEAPPATAVDC